MLAQYFSCARARWAHAIHSNESPWPAQALAKGMWCALTNRTCFSHQVSLELADDEVTNVRVKYFDTVPVAKVGRVAT